MKLGDDNFITFEEEGHKYFDPDRLRYTSVSNVLDSIKETFLAEPISYRMALSKAGQSGDVKAEQKKILAEWAAIGKRAADYGTAIHNSLELYFQTGQLDDDRLIDTVKILTKIYGAHYSKFQEVILYSKKHKVCGTTDVVLKRTVRTNVYDFADYKTNIDKGILYDSRDKHGKFKNKFFFAPLQHLEDCNYNRYAMQLSIYAYLAEITYDIRVGRLFIIFIDPQTFIPREIPVPYLRMEAEALLESWSKVKPLPKVVGKISKKEYAEDEW